MNATKKQPNRIQIDENTIQLLFSDDDVATKWCVIEKNKNSTDVIIISNNKLEWETKQETIRINSEDVKRIMTELTEVDK